MVGRREYLFIRFSLFVALLLYGGDLAQLPHSLSDLNEFRTKILDPAVFARAQTGSVQWSRLVDIGTNYRNSAKGAEFEARLDPGNPIGALGYFHMCRVRPCTFSGGLNIQNPIKGRPIFHITRAVYSVSSESFSPTPSLAADGISPETPVCLTAAFSPFGSKYGQGGLAVAILVLVAMSKAKADWGKFPLKSALAESSRKLAKFVVDNALMLAVRVENGFPDGPIQSLWFE